MTDFQRDVLYDYVVRGMSLIEIGAKHHRPALTVRRYILEAMHKAGFKTREEMLRYILNQYSTPETLWKDFDHFKKSA